MSLALDYSTPVSKTAGVQRFARVAIAATALAIALVAGFVAAAGTAAASTSASGSMVVSRSNATGDDWDLVVRELGTNAETVITSGAGRDREAAWSPDGTKIAFVRETASGANGQLWVVNADGTNPVLITDSETADDRNPTWLPDGSQVVFDRSTAAGRDLFRRRVDLTGDAVRLTDNGYDNFEADVSPDGSKLVWVRAPEGSVVGDIHTDAWSSDHIATQPLVTGGTEPRYPQWSPDGTMVAFSRKAALADQAVDGAQADIWKVNADGSAPLRLTNHLNFDGFPRWMPNTQYPGGGRIAYTHSTSLADDDILAVNADGSAAPAVLAGATADLRADFQTLAGCSIAWDGGAATAQWEHANNWDLNRVPTTGDKVCIPDMKSPVTVTHSSPTTTITSLTTRENLHLNGGTLSAGTITTSAPATVTFNGGSLGTTEQLKGGTFVWGSGSSLGSTGPLNVASDATLLLPNDSTYAMSGDRVLINHGTMEFMTFDQLVPSSGSPMLINAPGGVIKKTSNQSGPIAIAFDNDGEVIVQEGSLSIQGVDANTATAPYTNHQDDGVFKANPGTALYFNGGRTKLGPNARLGGGGTTQLAAGILDIDGTGITLLDNASFRTTGGVLVGSGSIQDGTLSAGSGTDFGPDGTLTIAPGATLTMNDDATYVMRGTRAIENHGTLAVGAFDQLVASQGTPRILNASDGVLRKTTNQSGPISIGLDNDGLVEVQAGTLSLQGTDPATATATSTDDADSGTFRALSGSQLFFSGGRTRLAAPARIGGAGLTQLSGGVMDIDGTGITVEDGATFNLGAGTLAGSGTLAGGTFVWHSNANFGSAGTLTVAPSALLTMPHDATYAMNGTRTIVNRGTIDFSLVDALVAASGTPTIVNTEDGLLRKTSLQSGSLNIALHNDGLVESMAGELYLGGSDAAGDLDDGTFRALNGANLFFNGGVTRVGDATMDSAGTGRVALINGTLDIAGSALRMAEGRTFELLGGTLAGDGELATGTFRWSPGSSLGSAGTLTVAKPAVFDLRADATYALHGDRRVVNHGTINFGEVDNWTLTGGAARLFNAPDGVIRKLTAQNGTLSLPFDNDGQLIAEAGEIYLTGTDPASPTAAESNDSDAGSFVAQAGSAVLFHNGRTRLGPDARVGGAGTTQLSGGTLDIDEHGMTLLDGASPFRMTGGVLAGSGTLRNGTYRWSPGTNLGGTGTLTIAPSATFTLPDDATYAMNGTRVLRNEGTIDLVLVDNLTASGGSPRIVNTEDGLVRKTSIQHDTISLPLDNDGEVKVLEGGLYLSGTDEPTELDDGSFFAADQATLQFNGGTTRVGAATFDSAGTGSVSLTGGTMNIDNSAVRMAAGRTFQLWGGTLTGEGALRDGDFTWYGTNIGGSGTLTVADGATLKLPGDSTYAMNGTRTLLNRGVIDFSLADNLTASSGTPRLINAADGELRKTSAQNGTVSIPLDNDGLVSVDAGVLNLTGTDEAGDVDDGRFFSAHQATLNINGGTTRLGAATFDSAGSGQVALTSGTLNIDGSALRMAAGRTFQLWGGALTGEGALRDGDFTWYGTNIGDAGTLTVADGATLRMPSDSTYAMNGTRTLLNRGVIDFSLIDNLTASSGTPRLVNAADGEFRKTSAQHGTVSIPFENDGAVSVDAGMLNLTGTDAEGSLDDGTFFAADGGWLRFGAGVTRIGAASFDSAGSGRVQLDGTLMDISGSALRMAAGRKFEVNSGWLNGTGELTGGLFEWTSGARLGSAGTLTVGETGQLLMPSDSTYVLNGDRRLRNLGVVDFSAVDNIVQEGAGQARIENAGTLKKTTGQDGTLSVPLDNDGNLVVEGGNLRLTGTDPAPVEPDLDAAYDSGTFTAKSGTGLFFQGGRTRPAPEARFTGAGLLQLNGGNLDLESSALTLADGAAFEFWSGQIEGSGALKGGTFNWSYPMHLGGSGTLTVASDAILRAAHDATYVMNGARVLRNEGQLVLSAVDNMVISAGSPSIVNAQGGVLRKTGNQFVPINVPLDNRGTIDVVENELRLPAALTSNGAPVYNATDRSFSGGAYRVASGARLSFSQPMDVWTTTASFDSAGNGSIWDSSGQHILRNLKEVAEGGTLAIRNGATWSLPALVNRGDVLVADDSTLTVPSYTQTGGVTRLTDSTDNATTAKLVAPVILLQGGTVKGNGEMVGAVTNTGATIAPGNSPGTFTITGDYVQSGNGVLEMEIDGKDAGTFDVLNVSGSAVLGGTLKLLTAENFTPSWSDAFAVVASPTPPTVQFDEVVGQGFTPGMKYKVEVVDGVMTLLPTDVVAPVNPTLTSPSHTASVWSNDRTVDVGLAGASDDNSGVDGYAISWDTVAGSVPAAVKTHDGAQTTVTSPDLANGNAHWLHVRTVDKDGNWSDTVSYGPFFIDATAPSGGALRTPATTPTYSLAATTKKVPQVTVNWSAATDAHSGVAGYRLITRTLTQAAKTWVTTTSAVTTARTMTVNAAPGATYCFKVERLDTTGNTATSPERCVAAPLDTAGFSHTKTSQWSKPTGSSYYFGSVSKASAAGASISKTAVKAKRLWLVATTCSGCGSVQVLHNGKAIGKPISLASTRTVNKRVFALPALPSLTTGTLTIKVTTKGAPVMIDAVIASAL